MILFQNQFIPASHAGRDYHEDLVDLFVMQQTGYRPLQLHSNQDMEERDLSFALEPTWPDHIHDDNPTMKFTIESGIKIPQKYYKSGLTNELYEAMNKLEINQSFLVPITDPEDGLVKKHGQITAAIYWAKQKMPGKQFVTRKTVTPPPGIRVWRVE